MLTNEETKALVLNRIRRSRETQDFGLSVDEQSFTCYAIRKEG